MSEQGRSRTVLVTGASSGIGEACARHLAHCRFRVFASYRSSGCSGLSTSASITPIRLDITDQASVAAAATRVRELLDGRGLDGLVNNDGIFAQMPLKCMPLNDFRWLLEVNLIGHLAVTQAFLPMLRQERGRIVNIGSISGRSAGPFEGAYAASKFGLEAITNALRVELRPAGVAVSIIEPGAVAPPLLMKAGAGSAGVLEHAPPPVRESYAATLARPDRLSAYAVRSALAPERIAEAVGRALTAQRPKPRYVVGAAAKASLLLERLPTRCCDAILGHLMGLR